MSSHAAKPRVLSRSGQPRRRLARRRQQLPHPVRRGDRMNGDLREGDPDGLQATISVLSDDVSVDALLTGERTDARSETIVSD